MPEPGRLSREDRGEVQRLTPITLIRTAFDRQPDIKSSYQRFKSEEARYDFFVVSRDSLTPRVTSSNTYSEERGDETVNRHRDHALELAVEKQFFDTTELDMGVGLRADAENEAIGYRPFASARLRYPLWVSRRKLERTSEEIFRRNELNDAQLGYIEQVRHRLQRSLFSFYRVIDLQRELVHRSAWRDDILGILERLDAVADRNVSTDRSRIEAELTSILAQIRENNGWLEIQRERLKAACGLPFHTKIELVNGPFNPFADDTHEELLQLSIETDPEIATLRNEERNAQVQLDLARRGRWDVALLLSGNSSLEGAGEAEGESGWSASFGIDVSAVDPRVTESLIRQAEARIERFRQAIVAREDDIFVETLEPIVRLDTVSKSRDELMGNLPRYQDDFRTGLDEYVAGTLNVDDLLKRREDLYGQQQEISRLTFLLGANVAELCSATGKFFELLEDTNGS